MPATSTATRFVCQSCGFSSPKWLGKCPSCEEWNSLVEEAARPTPWTGQQGQAVPYQEISRERGERISCGQREFDRVLGGGMVPGSLVLIGGEPGIGKSTLLLQISESLSQQGKSVLYVAGEESSRQIRLRGERLGIRGENLQLVAETCLERILAEERRLKPETLIVDSVQTVFTDKLDSIPGSISQIRECAAQLLSLAKTTSTPVFLIGHITKQGDLAGPKALEHIVDVVLYFEGDRYQNQRILRAVKNRFGPANELGIFQMTGRGLLEVENPSQLFLEERAVSASGSVVHCAMEGSRPVLVELQALVSHTNYSTARRMANGVDPNRVSLLLAVLEKRLGLQLVGSDVYVNVAGGLSLAEPAVDLAVVAAVLSSHQEIPFPADTVIFGEIGLAGEIRAVSSAQSRVKEAWNAGFQRVVLPAGNLPLPEPPPGMHLVGVRSVADYLAQLDRAEPGAIK